MAFDEKDKNTAVPEPKESPAAPAAPTAPPATGGYGDYLAGKAAPMSSAVSGYGDWLATQQKNHKVETAHEGAMTYGDYLAYTGKDPVGDYNAKVRQAELDYQKGLATYGQNAERMAKAGLAKSGYGEYLAGEAFAARGAAVTAAQQEAKTAQQQSYATYGEYLEGLKQKEQQEAEIQAAEQQQQAAVKQQQAAVQQQNLANATAAVSAAVADGATVDAAIAGLNGTYDAATLEKVRNNMVTSNLTQALSGSSIQIGLDDTLKGVTDDWLASSSLKDAEGNAYTVASLRKAMQGNNYKFLKELVDTGSSAGLKAYASYHGIGGDLSSEEVVDKIVDHMVKSGVIGKEEQQRFETDAILKEYETKDHSAKEYWEGLDNLDQKLANGEITEDQRDEILGMMEQRFDQQFGDIGHDGKGSVNGIKWTSEAANVYFTIDGREVGTNFSNATYQRRNGVPEEERANIIPLYSDKNWANKSQGELKKLEDGRPLEIGILNNRVVIRTVTSNGQTRWFYAEHANLFTKDDTDKLVMAWFLKHRNGDTLGQLGRA